MADDTRVTCDIMRRVLERGKFFVLAAYDSQEASLAWREFSATLPTVPDNIAAVRTALRVLTAIMDRLKPAPKDVEELHKVAPECPDLSPDELACEVVQRAIKKRAAARGGA